MSWRPKHKYGAKRSVADDLTFPSILERDCYLVLKSLQKQEKIRMFLMQVPFHLPAGKKHRVDFQVFTADSVVFIESKGRDLEAGKLRREITQDLFGIDIHVVRRSTEIHAILEEYG